MRALSQMNDREIALRTARACDAILAALGPPPKETMASSKGPDLGIVRRQLEIALRLLSEEVGDMPVGGRRIWWRNIHNRVERALEYLPPAGGVKAAEAELHAAKAKLAETQGLVKYYKRIAHAFDEPSEIIAHLAEEFAAILEEDA